MPLLALAVQETSTECARGATPVPESGTVKTGAPLLVRTILPFCAPDALARNAMEAFTLCPALSVSGVVRPVLNPVPVRFSPFKVIEAEPTLVIFTVCVLEVFNTRLPNTTLAGVAVRLAEPGTGVGVGDALGVGVGPGPAVDCDPFAHPEITTSAIARTETKSR